MILESARHLICDASARTDAWPKAQRKASGGAASTSRSQTSAEPAVASVRPAEAWAELEETLAVENARLDGAVFDTDGALDDIVEALDAHHQNIERSLAKFRKAATPRRKR